MTTRVNALIKEAWDRHEDVPDYLPSGSEIELFRAAHDSGLAVMLKGPTGCGKTRLVEHMAAKLHRPLYTVSCHEDLTATDLIGRFVLKGDNTEWVDGPLTAAVRAGGICYLDEVVEARQDAIVAIHSLTDHRRELFIERLGGLRVRAATGFQLVVSFNPGYQSLLKDFKTSTRQRMVSIDLVAQTPEREKRIVVAESGVAPEVADDLVRFASAVREAGSVSGGREASTRLLVHAAKLTTRGLTPRLAVDAAVISAVSDDPTVQADLGALADVYLR
jgi:nitric oxide reductase NorQ protein